MLHSKNIQAWIPKTGEIRKVFKIAPEFKAGKFYTTTSVADISISQKQLNDFCLMFHRIDIKEQDKFLLDSSSSKCHSWYSTNSDFVLSHKNKGKGKIAITPETRTSLLELIVHM